MGAEGLKDKLLNDDSGVAAGARPPPFAPGAYNGGGDYGGDGEIEVDVPSARVLGDGRAAATAPTAPRPQRRAAAERDEPARVRPQGSAGGAGGGRGRDIANIDALNPPPQIVIIRERRVYDDGVCCPLLTFILGFSFPFIWLLGCCQTASNNPSARFLARCSIIAFLFTSLMSAGLISSSWIKDGKWPWDSGCFFPWDKKC